MIDASDNSSDPYYLIFGWLSARLLALERVKGDQPRLT